MLHVQVRWNYVISIALVHAISWITLLKDIRIGTGNYNFVIVVQNSH